MMHVAQQAPISYSMTRKTIMTQHNDEHAPSIGLLTNKVALVTGAGRGIGAAAARLFAREGAKVMLASRTESELSAVVEEIRATGGIADYIVTDVASAMSVQNAVQSVVSRYGRLDIAFNNAGVAIAPTSLAEIPENDFDMITAINYKGIWLAMVAEVHAIRATAGRGAIVNNSSVGSFRGNPGLGAYAATKRAINSLTETAAREYGPEGIRVNAVAPGTTMTAMMQQWAARVPDIVERLNANTPLQRAASPDEIAQAVTWLLSDRASYITGVVLPVDGGARA
jgi:NAD(P)-dependent dehydrogenase (short-subunit alcohol dehydrogenase family)